MAQPSCILPHEARLIESLAQRAAVVRDTGGDALLEFRRLYRIHRTSHGVPDPLRASSLFRVLDNLLVCEGAGTQCVKTVCLAPVASESD